MMSVGFIIPIIAFFFEAYPRFLNRKFGVDIWTHLLYLREYHRQGGIPKKITDGFIVTGEYDYPPAFITIMSKFPFRLVERYEFIFSPFFDAVHLVFVFWFTVMFSGSIAFALVVQALYVLSPIIPLENTSTTPRSLGYTLFSLTWIMVFLFIQSGDIRLLAGAVLTASGIFLSHRFTTQGLLFFSVMFSLLYGNVVFVFIFFLGLLAALVFSKGFYLKVLRGHLANLAFWNNVIEYRFSHQVKGNVSADKSDDFIFRMYNQFVKFPPFVLAITNPWVLPVFIVPFLGLDIKPIEWYFFVWVLFSYILSVLTLSVKSLRFLGEGQRYLELSAFPAAYLAARVLFFFFPTGYRNIVSAGYIFVAAAAVITVVVIQRKAIIFEKLRTLTPDMERMFAYLKSLRTKPKLLCIPHQITTNTIFHTDCPVFVNADYTQISKITDVYPYLRIPVEEVMKKHGLDMILLNEAYATIGDLKIKSYKEIKRVGSFVLLGRISK